MQMCQRASLTVLVASIASLPVAAQAQDAAPAASEQSAEPEAPVAPLGNPGEPVAKAPSDDQGLRLPRVQYDGDNIVEPLARAAGSDRGTTVLERRHAELEPVGIRAGSFEIHPTFMASAAYDTNVFRQRNARGDAVGRVRGTIDVQSKWNTNALAFQGFVDERAYTRFTSESGITYDAALSGRLDINRDASISAGAQFGRIFLDRGATTETISTRQPVRYNRTAGTLAAKLTRGRFDFSLDGLIANYNYFDSASPTGTFINQQIRDYTQYRPTFEVGYSWGGGPILFASASYDVRRYRLRSVPVDRNGDGINESNGIRDADGIELLAGVRGDVTPLLRGRFGIGFLSYDFKDPAVASRRGVAVDIRIDYLYSDLTTFSLTARRTLKNVASVTIPGAFATNVSFGVDHELLRNLILSGRASYEYTDYTASPLVVQRYGVGGGAKYRASRWLELDGNLAYTKRQENGGGLRNFDEVEFTVAVRVPL